MSNRGEGKTEILRNLEKLRESAGKKEMEEAGIRGETPRDARKAQLGGLALSHSAAPEDSSPVGPTQTQSNSYTQTGLRKQAESLEQKAEPGRLSRC